ncbi:unnamed protein product [Prorocentrum cordatum]|uniref:Uncharacterized protein n=1 Tax=Prorocentrum cordatum TaxID=2364126 RepID=A0ABN9Y8P0_9DINO|nr:unnamed protein product [Polarella glacialis]
MSSDLITEAGKVNHAGRAPAALRAAAAAGAAGPEAWAASWVDAEIARSPVVLFGNSACAASRAVESALRDAGVHAQVVEVDRMALAAGGSWPSLVSRHLAVRAGCDEGGVLPALFVGGKHVREGSQPFTSIEFMRRCSLAGAVSLHPVDTVASENWSVIEAGARKGRVRPPKDFNGRRWYMDKPDMAEYPNEHNDLARIEYGKYLSAPQMGWYQPTAAGEELMRQRTLLDAPHKPDESVGDVHKKRPDFSYMDLALTRDYGSFGRASRKRNLVDKAKFDSVTREMCVREGLSRDELLWVLTLNRKQLASELTLRHLRDLVVPAVDIENLRDALRDALRAERRYSPTRHVRPGSAAELTADQLAEEIKADSGTVLLVAVVSPRSPPSLRLAPEVGRAAARLQKAARIVAVDGLVAPDVCRHFKAAGAASPRPTRTLRGGKGTPI